MIEITYNGQILTEHNLFKVQTDVEKAMVAESLGIDTISIEFCLWGNEHKVGFFTVDDKQFFTADGKAFFVQAGALPDSWSEIREDSRIVLNVDGEMSVFYPKTFAPVDKGIYQLEGVSIMGVLQEQPFEGALYQGALSGDTVGSAIADIMGDYPYTIDPEVEDLTLENYLPRTDKREALRQILFPFGISVMKDANGNAYFKYNQPDEATPIETSRVLIPGPLTRSVPATSVRLIEHSFFASAQVPDEVLFDNTGAVVAAAGQKVQFDEPIQISTLQTTGSLTIDSATVNTVTLSGVGVLTGKKFLHMQRVLQQDTGAAGRENELAITDAWLVNPLNSFNTLRRVASYIAAAETVARDIYTTDYLRAGNLLIFPDTERNQISGYLKRCSTNFSQESLASCEFVSNWRPNYVGNNYNAYLIITAEDLVNGTWTVPQEMQGAHVLVTLFGGLRGGHSGGKGEDSPYMFPRNDIHMRGGDPGAGGLGGDGGEGAMVYAFEMDLTEASYSASIGQGGRGGISPDGEDVAGDLGGDTTLGSASSANGTEVSNYVNLIDGSVYCEKGNTGEAGAPGGRGGMVGFEYNYTYFMYASFSYRSEDGHGFGEYSGGSGAQTNAFKWDGKTAGALAPGGGGGAAAGNHGSNANYPEQHRDEHGDLYYTSGAGANGAQATLVPAQADFAKGGTGGFGGGGAGGIGGFGSMSTEGRTYLFYQGAAGIGGLGSQGGPGADGFILMYFFQEVA